MSIPRHAFTLIELMISVSLSLIIVLTAMAGFRVTAQTITMVNRLAVENQLLRAGVFAGIEELDFWTAYDDPHDRSAQPLRTRPYSNPFRPLREGDVVNDPDALFLNVGQHDPRAWWRGQGLFTKGDSRGDYSQFARTGHALDWRRALPEAIDRFDRRLGLYGMVDYLPGNLIYAFYTGENGVNSDEFARLTNPTDAATDLLTYANNSGAGFWWEKGARPKDICTMTCVGAITFSAKDGVVNTPADVNRHIYQEEGERFLAPGEVANSGVAYVNQKFTFTRMFNDCTNSGSVALDNGPSHWPTMRTTVLHYIHYTRQNHVAAVTITSPLTGESQLVRFSATGSTLRGARQQRGLDQ